MATKIKVIASGEFLEVTPDGNINITTSRKLLVDIAKAENSQADHELFIDFRDTHGKLSVIDLYQLATELVQHGDTFRRKVALLVTPGLGFDRARFFETCSHNRGFAVNAFTDYEKAMRWILAAERTPVEKAASQSDEDNGLTGPGPAAGSRPDKGGGTTTGGRGAPGPKRKPLLKRARPLLKRGNKE